MEFQQTHAKDLKEDYQKLNANCSDLKLMKNVKLSVSERQYAIVIVSRLLVKNVKEDFQFFIPRKSKKTCRY